MKNNFCIILIILLLMNILISCTKDSSVTEVQNQTPQVLLDKDTSNVYIKLAENEEIYIQFLEFLCDIYYDNTVDEIFFNSVPDESIKLIEEILKYKYEKNNLLPDFVESFSYFWNDEVSHKYPDLTENLNNSFLVEYNVLLNNWIIESRDNNTIEENQENNDNFEWIQASGNLYTGVELYIGEGIEKILYGIVTDFNYEENLVQIYLAEGDNFVWLDRRSPLLINVLFIRLNDPNLK